MRPPIQLHFCVLIIAAWAIGPSAALVSAPEAQGLKSRLPPVGAERAGNAVGTIPAWTGGVTSAPGYVPGTPRPDPFAADKPLFSITARYYRDYADKLPEGAKALFAKYPDYRMDIYPTHRSAAAPEKDKNNIFRNATSAH